MLGTISVSANTRPAYFSENGTGLESRIRPHPDDFTDTAVQVRYENFDAALYQAVCDQELSVQNYQVLRYLLYFFDRLTRPWHCLNDIRQREARALKLAL